MTDQTLYIVNFVCRDQAGADEIKGKIVIKYESGKNESLAKEAARAIFREFIVNSDKTGLVRLIKSTPNTDEPLLYLVNRMEANDPDFHLFPDLFFSD